MYIIICEDSEPMKNSLYKVAESCIMDIKEELKCDIITFDSSCEELDRIISIKDDKIYILDIELKEKETGTFIAQKIRLVDRKSKIIFITSHDDEIQNILYRHIEVIDFISKSSDFADRLKRAVLNSISLLMKPEPKHKIIAKDKEYTCPVYFEDILYVVNVSGYKYLNIHTINGIKKYKSSIKNIINELDERFLQIKSNTIVNKDYIDRVCLRLGFNKKIILITGETLTEISRAGEKELRKFGY